MVGASTQKVAMSCYVCKVQKWQELYNVFSAFYINRFNTCSVLHFFRLQGRGYNLPHPLKSATGYWPITCLKHLLVFNNAYRHLCVYWVLWAKLSLSMLVSRWLVENCEANKKQHVCTSSGLCDHYSELFTQMASTEFYNAVAQLLLQLSLSLLQT